MCSKAMAKVAPLLFALSQDLSDKNLAHVPKFATSAAQKAYKELQSIEEDTKQRLKSLAPNAPTWSLEDLTATCKEAQDHAALLASLLATARKHATKQP